MCNTLISVVGTLAGTLLGTWLGYVLSIRSSERNFRRMVLRDITFEYRRLAHSRESGGIQGLIKAGICQCENNKEYAYALNLVDDLKREIESGVDWRPANGDYVKFFTRLRREGMDPRNGHQMRDLKAQVENT